MERQVLIEMMEQRGYILEDENLEDNILIYKKGTDKIMIFLTKLLKFKNEYIKYYITKMKEYDINHCIGIYIESITPAAKNDISLFTDKTIELFNVNELQFNITKHFLQPKFVKLPHEEAVKFKSEFSTSIPVMKKDDAISKFYNYKKGDIIRIFRKDGHIIYRIVR